MQALKNLWSLSTWMLRRILSVLSLFCQPVLGLHARQNLLHLITPIIVIIPTCLSLWCRQWPKACQCHHSTGKMNSHPSKPPKHISRIHRATAATTFKIICSRGMSSGITPTNSINFRPRKLGCCGLGIWPLLRCLSCIAYDCYEFAFQFIIQPLITTSPGTSKLLWISVLRFSR